MASVATANCDVQQQTQAINALRRPDPKRPREKKRPAGWRAFIFSWHPWREQAGLQIGSGTNPVITTAILATMTAPENQTLSFTRQ